MNFRMAIQLELGGKWFATKFTSLLRMISYSYQIRSQLSKVFKKMVSVDHAKFVHRFFYGDTVQSLHETTLISVDWTFLRVFQKCHNVRIIEIFPYLLRFCECNPNDVFVLCDHWKLHHMICTSTETVDDGYSRDVSTNDNHRIYFHISSNEIHRFSQGRKGHLKVKGHQKVNQYDKIIF